MLKKNEQLVITKYYNELNERLLNKYCKLFEMDRETYSVKYATDANIIEAYKASMIFWINELPKVRPNKKNPNPHTSTRETICLQYIKQFQEKLNNYKKDEKNI